MNTSRFKSSVRSVTQCLITYCVLIPPLLLTNIANADELSDCIQRAYDDAVVAATAAAKEYNDKEAAAADKLNKANQASYDKYLLQLAANQRVYDAAETSAISACNAEKEAAAHNAALLIDAAIAAAVLAAIACGGAPPCEAAVVAGLQTTTAAITANMLVNINNAEVKKNNAIQAAQNAKAAADENAHAIYDSELKAHQKEYDDTMKAALKVLQDKVDAINAKFWQDYYACFGGEIVLITDHQVAI